LPTNLVRIKEKTSIPSVEAKIIKMIEDSKEFLRRVKAGKSSGPLLPVL